MHNRFVASGNPCTCLRKAQSLRHSIRTCAPVVHQSCTSQAPVVRNCTQLPPTCAKAQSVSKRSGIDRARNSASIARMTRPLRMQSHVFYVPITIDEDFEIFEFPAAQAKTLTLVIEKQ